MLYTSLFVWEMSVRCLMMIKFVMWILMSSVEGYFLILLKWWNAWFYWEKIGICKEIFWIFYEDFLRKFCDFWSSSIEALFYKGWEVFWKYFWWFLVWREWRKWRKMGVLSNSVSNSKWGSRHGKIRYAVPGNRTLVLKCKPRPHLWHKTYYNSTVLWYVLL